MSHDHALVLVFLSQSLDSLIHIALRSFCEMDLDNFAEKQADRVFQVWVRNLLGNSPEEPAGKIASQHVPGTPVTAKLPSNGAFNVCYRVTFENKDRVVVRFTALGRVIACNEKVLDETALMEYVAQHTAIPIPKIFGYGKCVVGPYIVMSFVEGDSLSGYLQDASQETETLSPRIPLPILRRAYFAMAEILLEQSKPEFTYIGAIRKDDQGGWAVSKRPFTMNLNRLAQFSNIPLDIFE